MDKGEAVWIVDTITELRAEVARLRGERDEELARLQYLNIEHRAEIERLRGREQTLRDLATNEGNPDQYVARRALALMDNITELFLRADVQQPAKGLFSQLTPEQQAGALSFEGDDTLGPVQEPNERLAKRPVAFRVKDHADGWILFHDEHAAYKEAEETGALMQGLYVRDGAPVQTPPDDPIEKRAEEIYAGFTCYGHGTKPAWVPRGNSLKQDEARDLARKELSDPVQQVQHIEGCAAIDCVPPGLCDCGMDESQFIDKP